MTNSGFQINYDKVEECIQEMDTILTDLRSGILEHSAPYGSGNNSSGKTYEALEALSKEVEEARYELRCMVAVTQRYVKSVLEYHKTKDAQSAAQISGKAGG